ncbi:helix-turn-helix domain-containing protein [Herbidospora galbida]|uniref:helix-turn-helix domain-containing protein n=1 Tax=Herbidospora galbida TaxID=2575442 RepID=UPI001FE85198|nr:helix-turn-helix domain-containing protein [Herbidospora galbida]
MRTTYKVRVYPTPEQAAALNRTFGCVRVVWTPFRTGSSQQHKLPEGAVGWRSPTVTSVQPPSIRRIAGFYCLSCSWDVKRSQPRWPRPWRPAGSPR